ncbi:MAG TPA: DUF3127 domain-containing protein [Draconibacterium sp.]|nr:DUF3127 domain-containing protein [Draconibacterium sp.]
MSLQVKGKVQQILKPESGVSRAGKEWQKQEFVIETEEQFPRKVCFTLFNDKVSLIDGVAEGDEVEVAFNLESREFNGKWYHNINAWKIDKPAEANMPESPPEFSIQDIPPEPEDDAANDLPF